MRVIPLNTRRIPPRAPPGKSALQVDPAVSARVAIRRRFNCGDRARRCAGPAWRWSFDIALGARVSSRRNINFHPARRALSNEREPDDWTSQENDGEVTPSNGT